MKRTARLIVPALRYRAQRGFADERAVIDRALTLGVGGFCIFGGDAASVSTLTTDLRARSRVPLLIGSDVERGAGQQFAGATSLPPLAALGSLDDLETTRRAAALTAREALALGVNWLLAPVADVDLEAANPIVGSRSFGTDPKKVAAHVAAWIDAAQAEGVLCCAKHFPGHGRTVEDSHETLPRVTADSAALQQDLQPFRAAIGAGAGSVMTAHVLYDALDAGAPATLSPAILRRLLRESLAFDGLVVTDGLGMEGLQHAVAGDEAAAGIAAVNAGCDALLYPKDPPALAAALAAADGNDLDAERVADALGRVSAACARVRTTSAASGTAVGSRADLDWADEIAVRACHAARGRPHCADSVRLLTIDEDAGGPYAPPSRATFTDALRAAGVSVDPVTAAVADGPLVIAVFSDVRASKSVVGLSPQGRGVVHSALETVPDATVVVFGHARLCERIPGSHVLAAWGGEPVMQRAAARWLRRSH